MTIDRREARREFKEKKNPRGVFALRCDASGGVWVSGSVNLNSAQTGLWFLLRNGMHHNKALQAEWNANGAGTFSFEVLEKFDEDDPAAQMTSTMMDRQRHWEQKLGARAL